MKEKGILFTPENIRSIMSGRKTQTRRILKGSLEFKGPYNPKYLEAHKDSPGWKKICPYGEPGDRLYVKEGFGIGGARLIDPTVNYRADGGQKPLIGHASPDTWSIAGNRHEVNDADLLAVKDGWISALFMPKWAARTWLKLTDVRIERLQDISEEDALAEGPGGGAKYLGCYDQTSTYWKLPAPIANFGRLWDEINGKTHPWSSNPWVWVLDFRRVK